MNRTQKAFWIFVLLTVFTMIPDRLLFVLFPIYLIQNNFSATAIGIIFSVAALLLALSRTFIGRLSDRIGRKRMMSLGLLIDGIAISFYPAISKIYEFAVVKGIKEIGYTLQESLGDSLQADSFPRKTRPRYIAKLGIVVPIARAMSAIVGIIIVAYFSIIFGFYIAAFFMFVAFLFFAIFYKDSKAKIHKEKLRFNLLKHPPKVKLMAFASFMQSLTFAIAYYPAFFVLAEKHLAVHADTIFMIFLVLYILATFILYFISRHIYSFGKKNILIATFILFAVFIIAYAFVQSALALAITAIIIGIIYYVWRVSFKTISMDCAEPKQRGEQLGFIKTMDGVGMVIGPLVGGILIDTFGIQMPFLVSAPLFLLAALVLYFRKV